MFCLNLRVFSAKPTDGIPVQTTNKEEFIQDQSAKANELLENFDINAAGKLIQKRYPSTRLLSDDVLLSEDEKEETEPAPKKARQAGENNAPQSAAKVAESAKPAKVQNAQANAVASPKANIPKKRNDNVGNANNGNANIRKKAPMNRQGNGQQGNGRAAAWNMNRPQASKDSWQMDNNAPLRNNRNNSFDNRGGGGLISNNRSFGNEDFTRRSNFGNDGLNSGGNDGGDSYVRRMNLLMSAMSSNNYGGGNGAGNNRSFNRF